jgi:hypothetical protein
VGVDTAKLRNAYNILAEKLDGKTPSETSRNIGKEYIKNVP